MLSTLVLKTHPRNDSSNFVFDDEAEEAFNQIEAGNNSTINLTG